jgi:Putative polyhydroxyalkanoic acid system protein (PHA_gran_rgn)
MPALSVSIPNPVGQEEASRRLKSFLAKLKEHYQDKLSNLEEEWPAENHLKYRFKTFGFDIQGEAIVEQQAVQLNLTLPFAAMMFKSKIEQTMRDEIARVLGPRDAKA